MLQNLQPSYTQSACDETMRGYRDVSGLRVFALQCVSGSRKDSAREQKAP
jgi:hypothetical protein